MEKYGTYKIFKNKKTGEMLRVALDESLEKKAEDLSQWEELDEEPKQENK